MSRTPTAGTAAQATILLIARLAFGVILVARAWSRWQIEGVDAQVSRLVEFGIPQAELVAWGTILLEGIGGVMIALGLLTRLVAALVATQNILVIVFIKWFSGPFLNAGGYEYNAALAVLGLVFLAVGARFTGLDSLLFGRSSRADDEIDLYQPKLGSTH
ncbi:MAG: DoxX family protein [Brooklawnia sp.]|jgi:putative oxidoreductase